MSKYIFKLGTTRALSFVLELKITITTFTIKDNLTLKPKYSAPDNIDFPVLQQWSSERALLIHGTNGGAHSPSQ